MASAPIAPRLEDVAKAAGVSTATVSRCLNTPQKVSEKTRAKVMHAVDQLGYTPHFGARVMAVNRSFIIGAIVPTMENAIFARGLQALQEALSDMGYTLLVSSSSYSPRIEAAQIRSLIGRGADGLFLIGQDRDPDVYTFLQNRRVPTVLTWNFAQDSPFPYVGFDNRRAAYDVAQAVCLRGHRDIAIVSAATFDNDRARHRVEGFHQALRDTGLEPCSVPVIETTYSIESGGRAFEALMRHAHPPTAILCGNDVLAAGVIKRASEMGIDIPTRVSVTGFDDIELAQVITPRLTTVHVPHRRMGNIAARTLVEMIEGTHDGGSVCLDTSLMLRLSLGPAPSHA
ncbi:MAG: LacI family DNA-binding transcriptional regulator [Pseudomonadota bacterium]